MPLILFGLGAAFIGAQIDNAIHSKFGTVVQPDQNFSVTRLAVTGSLLVFVALGVKKLLK